MVQPLRAKRKKPRHSVRLPITGRDLVKPIRSRRRFRPFDQPDEILEGRAADVDGSILERVVYKELERQLGPAGFIFKRGINGARLFRGGIEIDFLITARHPNIALEVLGAFWHGPEVQFKDFARAITVAGLPGLDGLNMRYTELTEDEIRRDQLWLEERIANIIGGSTFQSGIL